MYLIPRNVRQRFEFFPGMGFKELFLIIGGLAAGLVIFLLLGLFTKSVARIIIFGLTAAIGYFLGKADPRSGKNVLDIIRDAKHWQLTQKRYLYVFGKGGGYVKTPKRKAY
ncbi:MAG: PrgI family protein [Firmicutes bacterium]|nr:PrgI family protein [Bacillota bacterium]